MLSASSRRFRCYIAAASGLCGRTFRPNSAPIPSPIHNPTPSSTTPFDSKPTINPPFFFIASRSISNSQASSSEEEAILNQILSAAETAAPALESLYIKRKFLSPKSYNRLLVAAAAESNGLFLVSQLLQVAIASRCQPLNSICLLTVAKVFAKSDDCAELLRLTKKIMELTSHTVTIINRVLFAFGECGETEKALLIFAQMKNLNFVPDLYTHNTILEILGRAGRIDEMLGQFGAMKEAGIDPDVVSYNTVLNNLRKLGKFDVCLVYFKEMGENGVDADLLTYTAMIECLGRSGNVEESLRLLSEMKVRRIRPSLYVYRSLITNLKKMGKVDLALSLMEEMKSCESELAGPTDFKRNQRL